MENPNGLTKAKATHGKPKWAKNRQRRHMGNPNRLTNAQATHGKPNGLNKSGATWENLWAHKHTGDIWESQMGSTKEGRHMCERKMG
jgi:hypothetical protein